MLLTITLILLVAAVAAVVWAVATQRSLGRARVENARLAERLTAAEAQRADAETAREEFRTLSSAALAENAEHLAASHSRQLSLLLSPLSKDLENFRKMVGDCYSEEMRSQQSLRDQVETLARAAERVRSEAQSLGTALKGSNSAQGQWGEMMLETVLEQSGLRKGQEFEVQAVYRGPSGEVLRPDVVVHYPDGRILAIDAKVSYTAFLEYSGAADAPSAQEAGKRHAQAVRKQVEELRQRGYHAALPQPEGVDKPDFTVMFIPCEAAYLAALRFEPQLNELALRAHVVIASPSQLLALLRLVASGWAGRRQQTHALRIAEDAGKMLDKFADLYRDLEEVGKALDRTRGIYDAAINKLKTGRGNLLKRAADLQALGVKTAKTLPASSDDIGLEPDGDAG